MVRKISIEEWEKTRNKPKRVTQARFGGIDRPTPLPEVKNVMQKVRSWIVGGLLLGVGFVFLFNGDYFISILGGIIVGGFLAFFAIKLVKVEN